MTRRSTKLQAAQERYGTLDVLSNDAGIVGEGGRLAEQSEENWHRVIAINLIGDYLGIRHALPLMRARYQGNRDRLAIRDR